jgi:hypothetical protein
MSNIAKRQSDAIEPKDKKAHLVKTPRGTTTLGQRTASGWAKAACVGFGVALLGTLIAGFMLPDKSAVVAVAAPVLLAAMGFTRLDLFESFKGGGLELKLRQATADAEHATEEAKATLAEVRALGASLARLSLDALARANLLGEFRWSDKIRLRDDLKHQLQKLGVSEDEIDDADRIFRELMRYRLADRVVDAAREACQVERNGVIDADYMAFQSKTQDVFDFGSMSVPKAGHLRELVKDYIDEDVERCLRDYEHFETTGQLTERTLLDGRKNEHRERAERVSRKVEARKLKLAE